MWATEHSIETTASPESIWRCWSEVATWAEWNADIKRVEISGPFAAGSTIAMTPAGQDTVELRLSTVSEPNLFVDEADIADVVISTFHRIDRLDDGRSRVTYRMEITGPAAGTVGPEIGPRVSGDFPEVLAALVERAAAL